jgi:hypothetical protein
VLVSNSVSLVSFDHPIGPRQHVGRNRQTDLLGGFKIDDEFELLGRFGGLGGVCPVGSI